MVTEIELLVPLVRVAVQPLGVLRERCEETRVMAIQTFRDVGFRVGLSKVDDDCVGEIRSATAPPTRQHTLVGEFSPRPVEVVDDVIVLA